MQGFDATRQESEPAASRVAHAVGLGHDDGAYSAKLDHGQNSRERLQLSYRKLRLGHEIKGGLGLVPRKARQ